MSVCIYRGVRACVRVEGGLWAEDWTMYGALAGLLVRAYVH